MCCIFIVKNGLPKHGDGQPHLPPPLPPLRRQGVHLQVHLCPLYRYEYHLPLCPLFFNTLHCQGAHLQVPPTSVSPLLQYSSLSGSSPTGTPYICAPLLQYSSLSGSSPTGTYCTSVSPLLQYSSLSGSSPTGTTYICVTSSSMHFAVREFTYRYEYHFPLCPLFFNTLHCQGVHLQVTPPSMSPLLRYCWLSRSSPIGISYICVPSAL
jgi:hypothetical protein